MGSECVRSYGGTSYDTPNLDELARSGVRFEHYYTPPLCTPSRVQLMTGQYGFRNYTAFGILEPRERTFGHLMKAAGYRTCIAGKWQFYGYDLPESPYASWRGKGTPPTACGFDEYALWHAWHTEDKGSRYGDPAYDENGQLRTDTKGLYGDDLFSDFILRFIERHRNDPFFAYYPMALTHGPFDPPPIIRSFQTDRFGDKPEYFPAMVAYMDRTVGKMLRRLDDLGLRENTLVLFTTDNGTDRRITSRMGERVVPGGKGDMSDAGTRVPFIASWKGRVQGGRVTEELADASDVLPTLMELTGASWPLTDGRSLLPELFERPGPRREWALCHFQSGPNKVEYPTRRFVRDRRFKLYDDGTFVDVSSRFEERPAKEDGTRKRMQAVIDHLHPGSTPLLGLYPRA